MTDLVGHKITEVRLATDKEMDTNGFDSDDRKPLVIVLDNGTVLMPSRDEEGNGPGTIFPTLQNGTCFYMQAEQ